MVFLSSLYKQHSFDVFIAGESACDNLLNFSEVCLSACEGEILKTVIQSTPLSI